MDYGGVIVKQTNVTFSSVSMSVSCSSIAPCGLVGARARVTIPVAGLGSSLPEGPRPDMALVSQVWPLPEQNLLLRDSGHKYGDEYNT